MRHKCKKYGESMDWNTEAFKKQGGICASCMGIMTTETKHTPGPRCTECRWVHEADSIAGTSFQGVELCPKHAAAPKMLEALKSIMAKWNPETGQRLERLCGTHLINKATRAVAEAEGK